MSVDVGVTPALEAGTICAVAGQAQRQMRAWAAEHPALYDAKAFDPALFSTLALAAGGGGNAPAVRAASRAVQRVVRLLNDLGTYERDVQWGDMNGLLLDRSRAEVEERIGELTSEARTLLHDVAEDVPELARYMERQMDFCAGFYGVTDFWGTL